MVIIDISEELRYGYESNRHECNTMILDAVSRLKKDRVLQIRNERSLQRLIKDYVDVSAPVTMITIALFKAMPIDRVLDEINFHVSELLQQLYELVEYDDKTNKVTFASRILDDAIKVNHINDIEHMEYIIGEIILDWAFGAVENGSKTVDRINNYIRDQLDGLKVDSETSAEFSLRDRVLALRGLYAGKR